MPTPEGTFCFVPVEGDVEGECNYVFGMNVLSDTPPGEVVAVIHEGGQAAVEAFCDQWADEIEAMILGEEAHRAD